MSEPAPLHTAVREPRIAGSGVPPLLVMLHGYGSDEADLLGLADFLDPRLRVLSFRAPIPLDMGGYAWFPLEITAVGLAADYEAAERSLTRLGRHLDAVQAEHGEVAGDTFVAGFSQGGAMALELLLARPSTVSGAAFLSGLWSKKRMPHDPARRAAVKGKPVLQTHGAGDPLIPLAEARASRALLEELEVDLTYREYDMGHQIDEACLRDLIAWIGDRVEASASGA